MAVKSLSAVEAIESDPLAALAPGDRTWRTMGEEAFEMLRGAILSGALAPGEVIRIEDLCQLSGMSRMPIREALAQLQRIGLVEMQPRRTARVVGLSREDLKDVFDARLIVEVTAIAAAAREFGEEDEAGARSWLDRLRAKLGQGDRAQARKAHAAFHFALYRAASSRWTIRLAQPLWCSSERYLQAFLGPAEELLAAEMEEHEILLAACRAGEAERAASLLWGHLARAGDLIARQMGGEPLYAQGAAA